MDVGAVGTCPQSRLGASAEIKQTNYTERKEQGIKTPEASSQTFGEFVFAAAPSSSSSSSSVKQCV